jgi:hypothetical protein
MQTTLTLLASHGWVVLIGDIHMHTLPCLACFTSRPNLAAVFFLLFFPSPVARGSRGMRTALGFEYIVMTGILDGHALDFAPLHMTRCDWA